MITKTIEYVDYLGNKRKKECAFNLSKAELIKMNATREGGLENYIKKIVASENNVEIYKLFEDLILKSYGEISVDGDRFIKTEEATTAFTQTEAYSVLIESFFKDSKNASDFIEGIIPESLKQEIENANSNGPSLSLV